MALVLDEVRGQRAELASTNRQLADVASDLRVHRAEHATQARDREDVDARRRGWRQHRQTILSLTAGPLMAAMIFVAGHFWQNPPGS